MAGIRHGASSETFNPEELKVILAAADQMVVRVRGVGDDPLFMGRLLRTLLYTGIHISNFSGCRPRKGHSRKAGDYMRSAIPKITSACLQERTSSTGAPQMYLVYRRVKKKRDNVVQVPISQNLMPWLPAFLDQRKPTDPSRYNQLMKDLEGRLLANGHRIHLNPHRFRHTTMRLLRAEFGFSMEDIERIVSTTRQTLDKYARRPIDELAAELTQKGW